MHTVNMARSLFGVSMAFHIIFATMGVGIPFMILCAELINRFKPDADFALMARRMTKGFAINLGVAIPSGTIVGTMLALLWPGFMEIVGQVIAVPFQVEMWAFFLEALFLSIYVYGADRLSPNMRLLSVAFVWLGGTASAVLITDAHAWMNTPRGFDRIDGKIMNVDPWAAVFNPSIKVTAIHVSLSAFTAGAFVVVTIAAVKLLRRNLEEQVRRYYLKGLTLGLIVGLVVSLATALNGHETAQMLHEYLPEKLAAAEGLFETTSHAPLVVGGIPDAEQQRVVGGIEIPWALSFLATNTFTGVVRGLNDFPREDWPPLFTHYLFDLMVMIGSFLLAISALSLLLRKFGPRKYPRWLLTILVFTGPLALLAIEFGWIFSCSGRQPWTIYHVMRTAEAATRTANVDLLFVMFTALYVFLLVATGLVLRYYFRKHPVIEDLNKRNVPRTESKGV
ncbi:cytochrome D ubiquinol oxidase subunit I [Cohnella kolymensis]|uniref:Cytochrome D ubiquinol oxidase subunit I n=1 Tax=Cohnella kolymensis TaxID=1590652 RepID=A0ABR5A751_9BACL|nr:cytochrome ubiquinol oxidase subunit I [Cohnella kolymensis]KIL36623.1 cytochrome D ubiquinol oxidase subunit I [Cohnella kolymensis]